MIGVPGSRCNRPRRLHLVAAVTVTQRSEPCAPPRSGRHPTGPYGRVSCPPSKTYKPSCNRLYETVLPSGGSDDMGYVIRRGASQPGAMRSSTFLSVCGTEAARRGMVSRAIPIVSAVASARDSSSESAPKRSQWASARRLCRHDLIQSPPRQPSVSCLTRHLLPERLTYLRLPWRATGF